MENNSKVIEYISCTEVNKENEKNGDILRKYPFVEINKKDILVIWIIGSYISNSADFYEIFIKGWYVYSMLNEEEKLSIYFRWINDITSL